MNSKVDLWIEQHSEDMIKDLQKLVSFKSVSHAELAQPGAPSDSFPLLRRPLNTFWASAMISALRIPIWKAI